MMQPDQLLDALFRAYRDAVPEPEPSANFMPKLWNRIDGRRSLTLQFKRVAQVFVGSAAALCLLFTGLLAIPRSPAAQPHASYIDVLAEAHPADNLAALGIVRADNPAEASH